MRRTLIPDLLLDASGATNGVGVTVEDGRVIEVGPATQGERAPSRALAPGFVNAHSHAFQRNLRGRVERRDPHHPDDDFWTWRERMYALAEELDPATIREVSRKCYSEMLSAGYTTVVEFHYVHHKPDGAPYEDPNALARAVAEAAEEVGIRLLLLPTAYARGGIPRFRDAEAERFLYRVDTLRGWAKERPLLEVGAAAHSVRAVPRGWLKEIGNYAHRNTLTLHVHAGEQPREVEECLGEHGMRPVELLAETGFLGPRTVVIHATHADEVELALLADHGSLVCACPTTEGNLGDSFLPAEEILDLGIDLCVGSDSNVRIDPLEELREMETNARRLAGKRNVLVAPGEDSPVPWLLRSGWRRAGIKLGGAADFVEIDLQHPAVADVQEEDLPSALVFGADRGVVAASWVEGRRVYAREEEHG